jgi:hypothetical protein
MPDAPGNLFGLQPGLVPADNGSNGYTSADDVRSAAFDARRAGNQGADVNVGYCCVHSIKMAVFWVAVKHRPAGWRMPARFS